MLSCDLSPLHSTYLLHALLSLSFASHALAVVSYILSPAHVVVLALRVFTQWNLTNPRRNHPKRSLRFFVALWATQALVAAAAHAVTGSRGTKGPRGTYQRGIILDFVGQAVTPSLLHLLLVDLLLSLCQLTTLLLAFAATVPNDLDAASGEGARDYAILLGVDELEGDEGAFDEDEEQRASDAAGAARRRRKRRRSSASGAARQRRQSRRGYEGVPLEDTDDVEADDFDALEDEAVALGMVHPHPANC
ncbi:hypothetical protein Rhopal_003383-T1 [Rhodotorula paludigena]|uniref:DUF1746 domain-containing protein n=1 Tax=Rhodotorula paludigena TaxID=86838 RepID=A0AAV5GLX8_9BASI|nr:hypothetical protein Rhopal_003383-T1 [Rhodotorula paludigena]